MTDTLSRILRIVLAFIMAVSFAVWLWFVVTANNVDSSLPTEVKIDQFGSVLEYFMTWTYVLLIFAAGGALVAALLNIVLNPKAAVKTLIPIGVLALVGVLCYSFASSDLLHMPNYDGADNEPETLKWAGTGLYAMYSLFALAFGAIVVAEISKMFK